MIKRLASLILVGVVGHASMVSAIVPAAGANSSWKAQVSKAILEGRCSDAKTIALKANDIDTAAKAVMLCKPKPSMVKINKPVRHGIKKSAQRPVNPINIQNLELQFPDGGDWKYYHNDVYYTYYFDKSSIQMQGSLIIVNLLESEKQNPISLATHYARFDCNDSANDTVVNLGSQSTFEDTPYFLKFDRSSSSFKVRNLVCNVNNSKVIKGKISKIASNNRVDRTDTTFPSRPQVQRRSNSVPVVVVTGDGTPDDLTCQRYGYRPNKSGYSDCRLELDKAQRQARYQAEQSAVKQVQYEQQMALYQSQLAAQEKEVERARNRRQADVLMRMSQGMLNSRSPSFLGGLSDGFAAVNGTPVPAPPPPTAPAQPAIQNYTVRLPNGDQVYCSYSVATRYTDCR